jgi:hypothetical protein
VKVIWEQGPSETGRVSFGSDGTETLKESLAINVITKDSTLFNPSDDDVVQSTRSVYSRFSWHEEGVSHYGKERK